MKVVLFAFMENGYASVREIEKLCKTDIRFMWLLQDNPAPSFMTINNFMNECLSENISAIFNEINSYIFTEEKVDLEHVYIDGTKLIANANKYSWVWKKSSIKNRYKTFGEITELLNEINEIATLHGIKFRIRTEYAIEYMEEITDRFARLFQMSSEKSPKGRGHHKTPEQRIYEKLIGYTEKLKKYSEHIRICGENRNSYSKKMRL